MNLHARMRIFLLASFIVTLPYLSLIQPAEAIIDFSFEKVPVDIQCMPPEILPGEDVQIDVTIGDGDHPPGTGKAILLVIQPNKSPIGTEFEEWLTSKGFTPEQIEKIVAKIGSKCINVIGYLKLSVEGDEPYKTSVTYPSAFTPIVGELSTVVPGKYKVILIYCGIEFNCLSILVSYGFQCTSFFVIPEMPFGTIATTAVFFSPLLLRKLKRNRAP